MKKLGTPPTPRVPRGSGGPISFPEQGKRSKSNQKMQISFHIKMHQLGGSKMQKMKKLGTPLPPGSRGGLEGLFPSLNRGKGPKRGLNQAQARVPGAQARGREVPRPAGACICIYGPGGYFLP